MRDITRSVLVCELRRGNVVAGLGEVGVVRVANEVTWLWTTYGINHQLPPRQFLSDEAVQIYM